MSSFRPRRARSVTRPLHSHYVSLANGLISPAMSYPSGYEDNHPNEWRPATQREVAIYRASNGKAVPVPGHNDVLDLAPPPGERVASTPTSLVLEDDPPSVSAAPFGETNAPFGNTDAPPPAAPVAGIPPIPTIGA